MLENPLKPSPSLAHQSSMHCGRETDLLMLWNVNGQSNPYQSALLALKQASRIDGLWRGWQAETNRLFLYITSHAGTCIIFPLLKRNDLSMQWNNGPIPCILFSLSYSLWSNLQAGWSSKRLSAARWNQLVALRVAIGSIWLHENTCSSHVWTCIWLSCTFVHMAESEFVPLNACSARVGLPCRKPRKYNYLSLKKIAD